MTAADSLQMFDVAVGFKSVLSTLVNQQTPTPTQSHQTTKLGENNKVQTESSEGSGSLSRDEQVAAVEEEQAEEEQKEEEQKEEEQGCRKDEDEEPASKKARVDPVDLTGLIPEMWAETFRCAKIKHLFQSAHRDGANLSGRRRRPQCSFRDAEQQTHWGSS